MEDRERDRRERGSKTYNLDRLERSMKKELDLDEDQTEAIEELFEQRREEYAEELSGTKDRMSDQREQMSEFLERIREARRSGDREAEKEINEQIRELHNNIRVEQVTEEFLAALEKELYEEQIEKFRKIAKVGRSSRDLGEAARQRPGMLKRYVMRLNLDDDTKDEIEGLYEEVQEEMRSGQLTLSERREKAGEFYDAVMEMLDDEQKAQLNKFLGGDEKRSRRPDRDRSRRDRQLEEEAEEEDEQEYEEDDDDGYEDDEEEEEEDEEEEEEEEDYDS
jgi:hypothetical protein